MEREPERELERTARLYDALSGVTHAILRTADREHLLQTVCSVVVDKGGFAMAWIGWHDAGTHRLVPVAAAGAEASYVQTIRVYTDDRPEGSGPAGTAFRQGRTYVTSDIVADPAAAPWRALLIERGFHASAVMPIRENGAVCGTLNVYASEARAFQAKEVALLDEVAANVSFALDNLAREGERAKAQAAAENERLFSAAMIESMPGIVYFYDHSGRFLRWNRNFEVVSGYSDAEIAGMHPLDFFAEEERPLIASRIGDVLARGEASVEANIVSKTGTRTPYYFTGRRVSWEGIPCLVGMGIDLSEKRRGESALRSSEERFRSTVDNIVEGCQILSFDWRYLYLNETAAVHNRRPNAELMGRTMPEAWPGIEQSEVFAMLRRCMVERIPLHVETLFTFHDATANWFDVRCQPVPEGIFVMSIDISDRKRAQAEADQARAAIDRILESVTDAFVALDRDWRYTYVNERAARIFNRRREDLIGKQIWSEFPEGVGQPFHRAYERAMREGVEVQFEEYYPPYDAWFENRIYPSADGISIVFQDVTIRKRAERALLDAKANLENKVLERTAALDEAMRLLDAIIDHLPNPVFYKDAELRFLGANRAYEQAFGVQRAEMLGKTVLELPYLSPPERRRYQDEQLALLASGTTIRREAAMPFADQREHQTLYSVKGIFRTDGSPAGVVGSIVDITPLKESEAALAKAMRAAEAADRLKSAFLATMSHELRTPLNSIIGFTGILAQGLAGPLNEEQAKQLGMVRGSARHLLALINDVLDISKIEAGQMTVHSEPLELQALLERVLASVKPLADRKSLALRLNAAPSLPRIVSDGRRVEQILINLVNNALKFTERGSITVEATAASDGGVRLRVLDTGEGIRPDDLARLFQPFTQIDTGLTRKHEGTGLGLAICKRLASILGGDIQCSSVFGEGSTFTVVLPAGPRSS